MKLLNNLLIGFCATAGKDPRTTYCDLNELSLPENAEKWDCGDDITRYVPTWQRCYLKCQPGFIPTSCNLKRYHIEKKIQFLDSRRSFQKCLLRGWKFPNDVVVKCKTDGSHYITITFCKKSYNQ